MINSDNTRAIANSRSTTKRSRKTEIERERTVRPEIDKLGRPSSVASFKDKASLIEAHQHERGLIPHRTALSCSIPASAAISISSKPRGSNSSSVTVHPFEREANIRSACSRQTVGRRGVQRMRVHQFYFNCIFSFTFIHPRDLQPHAHVYATLALAYVGDWIFC